MKSEFQIFLESILTQEQIKECQQWGENLANKIIKIKEKLEEKKDE